MKHAHSHSCSCNQKKTPVVYNRVLQADPTRTLTIRNRFAADMTRRFRALQRVITESIVINDAFGLKEPQRLTLVTQAVEDMTATGVRQFAGFTRTSDKINGFMDWLNQQENAGILEISQGQQLGAAVDTAWTNKYITSGYQKGIQRGRTELGKAGFDVPVSFGEEPVQAAFLQPFHVDRVGAIYTRTFRGLKGITDRMDADISRTLAQGLAEGRNPLELAGAIRRITGKSMAHARTLARTEVVRAHHVATIQEYRNAGVLGIKVKAEWSTAGDDRVCAECAALEGRVFTLKEIENMIPLHPNCRCVALPVDITDMSAAEQAKFIDDTETAGAQRSSRFTRGRTATRARALRRARRPVAPKKKEGVSKPSMSRYLRSLSPDNKALLDSASMDWTDTDFRIMREFSRTGGRAITESDILARKLPRVGTKRMDILKRETKSFDAMLRKVKPSKDTTFRGMSLSKNNQQTLFGDLQKGDEYIFDAMTSTSNEKGIAEQFAANYDIDTHQFEQTMMHIKGKSGVDIEGLPRQWVDRQEKEVIFRKGSRFKVTKIERVNLIHPDGDIPYERLDIHLKELE